MSDDLTEKLPGTTAPLTLDQKFDVIIERLDVMQSSHDAQKNAISAIENSLVEIQNSLVDIRNILRKHGHLIETLILNVAGVQADLRDLAERIVTLERQAS